MSDQLIYLVEITAYTGAGTETLRYASGLGKVTGPTETPPNVFFEPRVVEPANFSRTAFSDARVMGGGTVGFGELVLNNADQGLNDILDYGLDGRECVIRVGPQDAAYPGGYTTFLTATMEQPEVGRLRATIRLRDKVSLLDQPLQATKYAGNNALPSGKEGTADDIKGRPKVLTYGRCKYVPPLCVNTALLIYQFHDGAAHEVNAVFDMGVALTFGADRANLAAMEATAPAPGAYDTCLAEGLIRLGATPAGRLTAWVKGDATGGYVRTVAKIVERILTTKAGVPSGDIDTASFAALASAADQEVGIHIGQETTARQAINDLLSSIGAWLAPTRTGKWQIGQLVAPGTPTVTFTDLEILDIDRRATRDEGRGIPLFQVVLSYQKFWTTFSENDIAGAVSAATRAQMLQEWRRETATDSSVQTKHLLATELARESLINDTAEAATEAARVLTLHKVRRDFVQATVRLQDDTYTLDMGSVVRLETPRLGYDAGRDFVVVGLTSDGRKRRLQLDLWG